MPNRKTYEEITKKFESFYWPDGMENSVVAQSKWSESEKEFQEYLNDSGWTREDWLNEQFKRVEF